MIHVIATIQVKEGRLAEFIEIFKSNIPHVLKEAGCIEYMLTVDLLPGLPRQEVNRNSATVIEKWNGVEALQAHLSTPHMAAYREKAKGLVENSSIRILKEA
jgi:quinol monooxygenase YgiN